jgi:hypothetical protein
MSSVPTVRDVATHEARADTHEATGDHLYALGDEWSAVCYFYAGYHLVKAAMNSDPIFASISKLSAVHPLLTLDARFAEHHSGGHGANGRSLGVNEVVMKLYKGIRLPYTRLHMASVHVRYGRGLETLSPQTSHDDFKAVRKAYDAGLIVAP